MKKNLKGLKNDKISQNIGGSFSKIRGGRFVGELVIVVNSKVTILMTNTLYDEKIAGSIHATAGMAYEAASNGSDSAIHWDLVLIQKKAYDGGKIYFNDVLIRKDRLFVFDELKALNP